jgi:hypothetical protein
MTLLTLLQPFRDFSDMKDYMNRMNRLFHESYNPEVPEEVANNHRLLTARDGNA